MVIGGIKTLPGGRSYHRTPKEGLSFVIFGDINMKQDKYETGCAGIITKSMMIVCMGIGSAHAMGTPPATHESTFSRFVSEVEAGTNQSTALRNCRARAARYGEDKTSHTPLPSTVVGKLGLKVPNHYLIIVSAKDSGAPANRSNCTIGGETE